MNRKNKQLPQHLQVIYEKIIQRFAPYRRVIVAFSGGVDSTLLLKLASEYFSKENVLACLSVSPVLSQKDYRNALELADALGVPLREISSDPLENASFSRNDARRCYYCRCELWSELTRLAQTESYDAVLCGANADDLQDYRPGQLAAQEYHIAAPLQEAGLGKKDIRALSAFFDLPTAEQPAQPCLATRIAYGLAITSERLEQIEQAEACLEELGFRPPYRVRHHDTVARIEVVPDQLCRLVESDIRAVLIARLKALGFHYVTADLQGFRSGSGNEILR